MSEQNVSVVVPAFNCEATIADTLKALLNQTFNGPIEVVVVDDGSTDRTAEIIKSFPSIKYISQENSGPAVARNRGAQETSGDFIFFTDSDCLPEPDWISKILASFQDPQIAVVAGSYGIVNDQNVFAVCIHKEIRFRHEKLMPDFPKSFGSYNFCVRRKVFEKVGGFNTAYRFASGEDNDLSYKILAAGHKIYFDKTALVRHVYPEKLNKYFFEQYRHGYWRVKLYLDHPGMSQGDDYTFWKDIVEIPIVLLMVFFLFLAVFLNPFFSLLFLTTLIFLIFLQLIYGLLIMGSPKQGLLWSGVMFVRALARAVGLFFGMTAFFFKIPPKKSK